MKSFNLTTLTIRLDPYDRLLASLKRLKLYVRRFNPFSRPAPEIRFQLTVGAVGTVVATFNEKGIGRVRFSRGDRSYVKLVEATDYMELPRGATVIVTDVYGPNVYVELLRQRRVGL